MLTIVPGPQSLGKRRKSARAPERCLAGSYGATRSHPQRGPVANRSRRHTYPKVLALGQFVIAADRHNLA
jgi:hypothetical protein